MSRQRRSAAPSPNHFHARTPGGSPDLPIQGSAAGSDTRPPSKTSRKNAMHALQDLGQQLTELPNDKLAQLELPDGLADAVREYRRFTKWEAKRRQMQYIGRLMRDLDPAPIAAQLHAWTHTSRADVASFHEAEQWRDGLLASEASTVLDQLLAAHPALDRKSIVRLVDSARAERAAGRAPASARQLFREIARGLESNRDGDSSQRVQPNSDAPDSDAPESDTSPPASERTK
jgi:ribosome-associated protein